MSTFQPFTPAANASISVTTTTGNAAIAGTGATLRLANVTAQECFVAVGGSTVAATTGGFSVPGNSQVFISIPNEATHVAAITGSSTATLRISRGDGG
jgi:hypothetical protein